MPADAAYVDTSVLGAYYCPEPLSEAAESALLAVRDPCISSLNEVEFASLIARKRRLREISDRQAAEVLSLFDQHVAEGHYRRIAVGAGHFLRARDLIATPRSSLHTLDALHLAVALMIDAPLLTADQLLARAARRHGATAILVK